MALIRWNPGTDIFNLLNEMTELTPQGTREGGQMAFVPLDIKRTDNGIEIKASLPGFQPDEVNVTVENGILTVDARKVDEREEKEGDFIRRERFTGRLYRQVYLGDQVNGEAAQASFQDGVLSITVPMTKKPEPRKIPVAKTVNIGNGSSGKSASSTDANQSAATNAESGGNGKSSRGSRGRSRAGATARS
jgi:HSP20 family protein